MIVSCSNIISIAISHGESAWRGAEEGSED